MSRYSLRPVDRRRFLKTSLTAAGGAWATGSLTDLGLASSRVPEDPESSPKARITIHADGIRHSINPNIYGAFIEHVDRCVNGGVFQENSPLSDEQGFRKERPESGL